MAAWLEKKKTNVTFCHAMDPRCRGKSKRGFHGCFQSEHNVKFAKQHIAKQQIQKGFASHGAGYILRPTAHYLARKCHRYENTIPHIDEKTLKQLQFTLEAPRLDREPGQCVPTGDDHGKETGRR